MKVLKYFVIAPLRLVRTRETLGYVKEGATVLDMGCGDGYLLRKLSKKIRSGTGIDERITPGKDGNIIFRKFSIKRKIPFRNSTFDVVTMTAFIEHLDNPEKVLRDVNRVLKKGGLCIITTPTRRAKPLWELLVKMGLSDEEADEEGIEAHKNYFSPDSLRTILEKSNFRQIHAKKFEFGMNYMVIGQKK